MSRCTHFQPIRARFSDINLDVAPSYGKPATIWLCERPGGCRRLIFNLLLNEWTGWLGMQSGRDTVLIRDGLMVLGMPTPR